MEERWGRGRERIGERGGGREREHEYQQPWNKVKNKEEQLGVVVHVCNPRLQRLREEEPEFEDRLGYIANSGCHGLQGVT